MDGQQSEPGTGAEIRVRSSRTRKSSVQSLTASATTVFDMPVLSNRKATDSLSSCRVRLAWILSLAFLALLWANHAALACPYCLSPPQTMAENISRADLVVVAELVRFRVVDGLRPESTLRIREYLQGQHLAATRTELTPGRTLIVHEEISGTPGSLYLLYGELPRARYAPDVLLPADGSCSAVDLELQARSLLVLPDFVSWNETTAITQEALTYLRHVPRARLPQSERLPYFLQYLEHSDPLIAIDAWAEFGNSRYHEVSAVRHRLPREKLREWIADPKMSYERLGLYGMMLGLCGTSEDASFLLEQMQDPGDQNEQKAPSAADATGSPSDLQLIGFSKSRRPSFRFGAEGMMGGYLLLQSAAGLDVLDDTIARSDDSPETAVMALIQALQFVWEYEPDLISRERLVMSMRTLLRHSGPREIVITNLARWEDWDSLPLMMDLFAESTDQRSTELAILQYIQTCLKVTESRSESRHYWCEADTILCRLQATRPDLFTFHEREFTAPQ